MMQTNQYFGTGDALAALLLYDGVQEVKVMGSKKAKAKIVKKLEKSAKLAAKPITLATRASGRVSSRVHGFGGTQGGHGPHGPLVY
jgi:nanoRNase/pAp phosphatase (c-di-AMP/oligoRNAs hydrolase)